MSEINAPRRYVSFVCDLGNVDSKIEQHLNSYPWANVITVQGFVSATGHPQVLVVIDRRPNT